jgi:hypothetical protein
MVGAQDSRHHHGEIEWCRCQRFVGEDLQAGAQGDFRAQGAAQVRLPSVCQSSAGRINCMSNLWRTRLIAPTIRRAVSLIAVVARFAKRARHPAMPRPYVG